MGICPQCGSFVDEGEPYCPYCSYYPGSNDDEDEFININGRDYNRRDVEEALRDYGYDIDDLERDMIDEDELEEILYDL